MRWLVFLLLFLICLSFADREVKSSGSLQQNLAMETFKSDLEFLRIYGDIDLLSGPAGNAFVAVSADLQGRVMTSSSGGMLGKSYGWINRPFFESRKKINHMNPYGGEERFWLGPEGGQFSIFFKSDDTFTLDNWQTPPIIDTEPFTRTEKSQTSVTYFKVASISNYAGFTFSMQIERTIQILTDREISEELSVAMDQINAVAYKSTNFLTNTGKVPWSDQTGLLSIWMLGMFNPSDQTTIVIPFIAGDSTELGPIVNDDYFGKVPDERLKIMDSIIYFRGDGRFRSKIGLLPSRAKDILGSYDEQNQILTIVKYSKATNTTKYVNSTWKIQEHPYRGDVINSYNDGAPAPGAKPLGPFYELETSSPALELAAGESGKHIQYTFHFEGSPQSLDQICQKVFGTSISQIAGVF